MGFLRDNGLGAVAPGTLTSLLDPADLAGTHSGKQAKEAAKNAAKEQEEAAFAGIAEQRRQFDITQESFRPFQEAGVGAIGQQQALLGLSGAGAQQSAFDQFNQSPGQQFLRDRAQKNLLRNSAAIGGLGGGNVRSALVQQGVGFAQQDFQNQFGRLGQLAGQGLSATTNVGQFGQNTANNIQQGLNVSGQARASGILGQQQAAAQQQQQLQQTGFAALSFFSDPKLKTNKKIIGEKNGHTIWSWTWNKLAESIGLTGNDRGVMANEVMIKSPEAVSIVDGYMKVNYHTIGV
jgi:hypothetical protein